MRRCEDCRIILDSNVRFCPKCGKQIAPDGASAAATAGGVSSLLASANLHRMRQEWEPAINYATEALKIDPKNAEVASVLADIYEQRGMLDDAFIWCQMALECNPGSIPEKARLDRINLKSRAQSGAVGIKPQPTQQRTITRLLVVMGLLVVLIIGAMMWGRGNKGGRATDAGLTEPRQRTPIINPGFRNSGPAAPSAGMGARPSGSAPIAGQAPLGPPSLRTPGEAKLRNDLQNVQQPGLKVDDAIADPRQGVLVVTFSVPVTSATKDSIISGAVAVARAAFASNSELNYVTARCVVPAGDGSSAQIAFVGDTARTMINSLGANPAPDALAKVFVGQWWNPQLK